MYTKKLEDLRQEIIKDILNNISLGTVIILKNYRAFTDLTVIFDEIGYQFQEKVEFDLPRSTPHLSDWKRENYKEISINTLCELVDKLKEEYFIKNS